MEELKLSLCIPTNGVTEWVIPVLDSIYIQNIDQSLFEVIVTDNGDNQEFKNRIKEYKKKVDNLIYQETTANGFTNQINAFELARGALIKFVNHRDSLLPGTIQYLLNFVDKNIKNMPYVYFSNGVLAFKGVKNMNNYDDFAYNLSYFLSWSAGIALWNTDFHKVHLDSNYSNMFPHLNFILPYTDKSEYIIDNSILFNHQETDATKKGKYNLFSTFSVEFMNCMNESLKRKEISERTYNKIKDDNEKFIVELYYLYCIRKAPCSYDLSKKEESLNCYYNAKTIRIKAYGYFVKRLISKITNKIKI